MAVYVAIEEWVQGDFSPSTVVFSGGSNLLPQFWQVGSVTQVFMYLLLVEEVIVIAVVGFLSSTRVLIVCVVGKVTRLFKSDYRGSSRETLDRLLLLLRNQAIVENCKRYHLLLAAAISIVGFANQRQLLLEYPTALNSGS